MGLSTRRAIVAMQLTVTTCLALGAAASCGSRTGLQGEEPSSDAGSDGPFLFDAPEEKPPIDTFRPDVPLINPCPDAAATLIYVVGLKNTLYSFDPSAGTFTPIGTITCPGAGRNRPFSMAVDREGIAYVIYDTPGQVATALYRVNLKTAACTMTSYDAAANRSETFGMGFVAGASDGGDAGEQLFISFDPGPTTSGNGDLATLDTTTFKVNRIGNFSPPVDGSELTGTGDGRLYAFSPSLNPGGSFIARIDPMTAKVMTTYPLPGIRQGNGWAFGFWSEEFYMFTGTGAGGSTDVHTFSLASKSVNKVANLPNDIVVGAGVSTCAPFSP